MHPGMRSRNFLVLLALVLLGLVPPAASQPTLKGNAWAVVVGINDYKTARRLRFAVADASAVADLLTRQGFTVTTLYNQQATRANILQEIGTNLLNNVGPEDRVLIYFSGHGMDLQKGQAARRGFLLPVEGNEQNMDATAIRMGRIRELAGAMPAKHVLFIVDACYGGIGGLRSKGKTSFVTNQRLEDLTREPSRWLITAGGADQEALEVDEWEHGLFTHFLLKGLDDQQLADRNQDKIITGSELWAYVEDVVYTEALLRGHKQRPELWRLAGDRGEFVFIQGVQPSVARDTQEGTSDEVARLRAEIEAIKQQMKQSGAEDPSRFEADKPEPPQVASAPPLRPARERRVFKVNLKECLANYDDRFFSVDFKGLCKVEKRRASPGEKIVEGTSESFHFYLTATMATVDIDANVNGYTITYWRENPAEESHLDHEYYIGEAIDELEGQEVTVVVTVGE